MAALSITTTSVVKGSGAVVNHGTAGAAITAGQTVYLDTADTTYKLADADGASALIRSAVGIALNGAAAGQPVAVQTLGDITLGAVLTAGVIYVLGDTAGGIMPAADLGTGDRALIVGIAKSTSSLGMIMQGADTALA